jgi:hypothetical protein
MVTMTGSFRAGQPTNAAVIEKAFAMAPGDRPPPSGLEGKLYGNGNTTFV